MKHYPSMRRLSEQQEKEIHSSHYVLFSSRGLVGSRQVDDVNISQHFKTFPLMVVVLNILEVNYPGSYVANSDCSANHPSSIFIMSISWIVTSGSHQRFTTFQDLSHQWLPYVPIFMIYLNTAAVINKTFTSQTFTSHAYLVPYLQQMKHSLLMIL